MQEKVDARYCVLVNGHAVEPGCWVDGHWGQCSDHYVEQIAEDELTDQDTTTCEHCGQWGHEDGLTEFSSSSCDGCGCRLGGSRFRLRVEMREATS